MFKKNFYFIVGLSLLGFAACKPKELPDAQGNLGSIVLLASAETQSQINALADSCLLKPESEFSQAPFFEVIRCNPENFESQYSLQKSVLVLVEPAILDAIKPLLKPFQSEDIEALMQAPVAKVMSARNVFARYQHLVYLFGKDANDLKQKLRSSRSQISELLMSYELSDQHARLFKDSVNSTFAQQIKDELGMAVQIPAQFKLKYHANKTFWFESETQNSKGAKVMALVVHSYPYRHKMDLSYESIRSVRDTVFKYLIKGDLPGTYMGTTESSYYPAPTEKNLNINGQYAKKINGWWTVRGLSQAGPYVRYVVVSKDKKSLFVFEGFVYTPEINFKESDIRLLESIALSIKPWKE